jgi:uncharacterized protein (DUF362 family)
MVKRRGPKSWLDLMLILLVGLPLLSVGAGRALRFDQPVAARPLVTPQPLVAVAQRVNAPDADEVERMVREALTLSLGGDSLRSLVDNKTVLLKVNLGKYDLPLGFEAWETTSWQVARAVVRTCQDAGAQRIFIGESPDPNVTDPFGLADYVSHITGVEYVNLSDPGQLLIPVAVPNSLWIRPGDVMLPQAYVNPDVVISVPKMKTHDKAGYSGALKNAIGATPLSYDAYSSLHKYRDHFHDDTDLGIHKTIVQVNLARQPDLAVMDAVLTGEGNGPWGTTPVQTNMILASRDLVALDMVALGFMSTGDTWDGLIYVPGDPQRIRHLIYAASANLGQVDMARVQITSTGIITPHFSFRAPPNVGPALYRCTTVIGAPPTSPVVDGDLAEWASHENVWLHRSDQVRRGGAAWGGETDASLRAWGGYDARSGFLYLAARVRDDHPLPNQRGAGELWDGDAVEFHLSVVNQDTGGRDGHYTADDFRLGVGYGRNTLYDIGRGTTVAGALVATHTLTDGYALEVRLPFTALHGFAPAANKEIGFDVALDDTDDPVLAHRKSQLLWSSTTSEPLDARYMGVALLERPRADVTPTPTETPSATPSATPSMTASATLTPTPSNTPTHTPSATPTSTYTPTVTAMPTATMTDTTAPTLTQTPMPTDTGTATPNPTVTRTATPELRRLNLPMILNGVRTSSLIEARKNH